MAPIRLFVTTALLASLAFTTGCRLSSAKRFEVAETVHLNRSTAVTCPAEREDRCADPSPVFALATAPLPHVWSIETGRESLLARLHLIRAARREISLQTYIFINDDSGNLVLRELLAAARRGVKVRILVDQLSAFGDAQFLSRLSTAHANLEIKVYNPMFGRGQASAFDFVGSVMCCFLELNHRMHNKLLVVDQAAGITGGRNYQNRYFDWDPEFNFVDRDVLVTGNPATTMQASFNDYWEHERSTHAEYLLDVSALILEGPVPEPDFQLDGKRHVDAMFALATDPIVIADKIASRLHPVNRVEYFADHPNKPFEKNAPGARDLTNRFRGLIANAKRSVVMQTPYMVFTRRAIRLFKRMVRDNPDFEFIISTNSLASTDSFMPYALSRKRHKVLIKNLGFSVHELMPDPADTEYWIPLQGRAAASNLGNGSVVPLDGIAERVSLHSKTMIIDDHITMIGSHNFDPRSEDFNTEVALIVWDDEFARTTRAEIEKMNEPQNSWLIARSPKVPVISAFSGLIANVSRKLPIFDIWPFRYATAYELKPGGTPVPVGSPDFREHWDDVGQFPGVGLSLRQIQTQVMGAFGGWVKPFL